jgi:hypothetical protein
MRHDNHHLPQNALIWIVVAALVLVLVRVAK